MDHFDWHRFLHGDIEQPVTLGRLSRDLVKVLSATDDRIYLHPSYAPKFLVKHGLTADNMQQLNICIASGKVVKQYRPRALSFLLIDQDGGNDMFHAVIKVTTENHELWVSTFHKIRLDEVKRMLKHGIIERNPK